MTETINLSDKQNGPYAVVGDKEVRIVYGAHVFLTARMMEKIIESYLRQKAASK